MQYQMLKIEACESVHQNSFSVSHDS